ncbi:MAG: molybdenum cofactor guanylyltransferase [Alphaproteobacteria bacterium]|nr:molybdenum cofactor guanylyltransferase [Alphaproteobacteria bacterium]
MPHDAATAGVILAGGKSSRMGHDKAQLRYGGKTLLEHMEALLRSAGISQVYISHAEHIADVIPGHGPLSGIHATLKALHGKYAQLLYVPVDMPQISPARLRALRAAPGSCEAVRFAGYMLPFRLRAEEAHITLLEQMLKEENSHALKEFQQRVALTELPVPEQETSAFANLNTPEEWRAFAGGAA